MEIKGYKMNKVNVAFIIAKIAHGKQKDRTGASYIYHPVRVASDVTFEKEKIVALLHDVVEDTRVTLEDIAYIFDRQIVEAVDAITKRDGEEYKEYLNRIKNNEIATVVKLADIKDNLDRSRLGKGPIPNWFLNLEEKYEKAVKYLEEE